MTPRQRALVALCSAEPTAKALLTRELFATLAVASIDPTERIATPDALPGRPDLPTGVSPYWRSQGEVNAERLVEICLQVGGQQANS